MTSSCSVPGQPEQAAEEKARNPKRRFHVLEEEKHKETRSETLPSRKRNVRMREERENSNEKIHGLELGSSLVANPPESMSEDGAPNDKGPLPSSREETRRGRGDENDRDLQKGEGSHSANDSPTVTDSSPQLQDQDRSFVPTSSSDQHIVSPTSALRGHHRPSSHSKPLSHRQSHSQSRLPMPDHDVDMNDSTTSSNTLTTPSLESTPSMENIIKVAAAAVAAQNAAAASAAANGISSNLSQSHQVVDSNLDPSLFSNKGGTASKNPSAADTKATSSGSNSAANSATTTSSTTAPTSSLSNNPYLSLSMLARQSSGSTTPSGHPAMSILPHPMYYPPNTLNTPAIYGNPYYYLAGSMAPGPNGMFVPIPGATFPPPPAQRPLTEPPRTVKPKRLKTHAVTTKSFSIPMVPRDKLGKPMLPLNVGIMTVINLGEVCMREHFHTERYIFPVGYEVTRRYLSTVDPGIEVVYHCTILDGGDGPKFQIIPSDKADKPIIAGTATGAWSNIVRQANAIRNRQHSNSVSGPDFFGLGQNTIKHLIQELTNSDRLRDYVWQNFVEGGPLGGRHAAVIPALPEEYDASMPIGAYYPKREVSAGVSRGLSHYPQHIIAQAETQKSQQLATQQAKESASAGSSSSSSPQRQEGDTLAQNTTQDTHGQITLPPSSSSKGLSIEHYQPNQQVQAQSEGPQKRATRSSTNTNPSALSASGRSTRASTRGSRRQEQQREDSASAPDTSTSEAVPTTFAGIMSQFPVPSLNETPHPGGS